MPQVVLNFGKSQKKELKKLFKEFESIPTKTEFEEKRWKAQNSTVTLYSTGKLVIQGNACEKVKEMVLEKMKLGEEQILGIDESGRGENFGSFVVSFVLGSSDNLRELRDSKKVKNLRKKAKIASNQGNFSIIFSLNSSQIDTLRNKGMTLDEIQAKIINGVLKIFEDLGLKAKIMADGKALRGVSPRVEFLVKGDDLEPVIGAASVLAKHFREEFGDKNKRKSWKNG